MEKLKLTSLSGGGKMGIAAFGLFWTVGLAEVDCVCWAK